MTNIVPLADFERAVLAEAVPFRSQFGATWFHQIGSQKPKRDWLVKDLILAKTFGIVYGPPGCGKSFLISDLMLTCSRAALGGGRPEWFGYKGRPFGVVYVVAEGRDDFEIRLHAWRIAHQVPDNAVIPFVFLPTSIDMRSNDADTKKLATEIKSLSEVMQHKCGVSADVVVIDTVARALAGGNENASEVMGAFVINCGKLQEMSGASVLGVHHGGKEAGRGPRGHEALHGAADFEIEVTGATSETPNVWVVRKLKAGPGGATHRFRLKQTSIGDDSDGDPVTSCIVVPTTLAEEKQATAKPTGWRVNQGEREFLNALATVIERKGTIPPQGLPVGDHIALVANLDDVRTEYKNTLSATETGTPDEIQSRLRNRWNRATKSLIASRVVGSQMPWLWFTGKPVDRFKLKGIVDAVPSHFEPVERDDPPAVEPPPMAAPDAAADIPEIPA